MTGKNAFTFLALLVGFNLTSLFCKFVLGLEHPLDFGQNLTTAMGFTILMAMERGR